MEQGLIHIYCGDGKGKTTCAAGLAVRCAGAGGKVLWVQFLKKDTSGERRSLEQLENVTLLPGYENIKFTFSMTEEEKKQASSFYKKQLAEIGQLVKQQFFDLLVMDETLGAINTGMLAEEEVIAFLKEKPQELEVVLTGRDPSSQMVSLADYVTNMQKIKHPFDLGISARKKIEW